MNEIIRKEFAHNIGRIPGRMLNVVADVPDGRIRNQQWVSNRRNIGDRDSMAVTIRFDDECNNGHETFAITAVQWEKMDSGRIVEVGGGCMHEEIAQHFPELAPFIKWHLTSTDGPMHYLDNVTYLAGDRDCWGLRKGEQRQIRNGKTGQLAWIRKGVGDKYFDGDSAPDETVTVKWEPWMKTGEGKERELAAARQVAVWPDATDAELCAEPKVLKAALAARLPTLLESFHADMRTLGFLLPGDADVRP